MRMDDVEIRWLGDDGDKGHGGLTAKVLSGKMLHTEEGGLFIDGTGENDPGRMGRVFAYQSGKSAKHGGQTALDITGAATEQATPFDDCSEGVNGHVVNRDGVLMDLEKNGGTCLGRFKKGNNVVPKGSDRVTFVADAEKAELVFEISGNLMFEDVGTFQRATHGVDAGDADEVA